MGFLFYLLDHPVFVCVFLVFCRIFPACLLAPFWLGIGSIFLPVVAIAISLCMALWTIPVAMAQGFALVSGGGTIGLGAMAVGELVLGICIGFAAKVPLHGIIGLFNLMGHSSPTLSALGGAGKTGAGSGTANGMQSKMALVVTPLFFAMHGHHVYLTALNLSFQWQPLGGLAVLPPQGALGLAILSGQIWAVALLLVLPMMGTLLLSKIVWAYACRWCRPLAGGVLVETFDLFVGLLFCVVLVTHLLPSYLRGFGVWLHRSLSLLFSAGMGP